MNYVRSEQTTDWMLNNAAALSRSDRALLHFARAFIYNPEVLVIHTPTTMLDGQLKQPLLDALRAFVDERGLEMPLKSRHKRRPRTVIFSTNSIESVKIADKILLCQDQQVRFVTFEYMKGFFTTMDNIAATMRRRSKDRWVSERSSDTIRASDTPRDGSIPPQEMNSSSGRMLEIIPGQVAPG